MGRVRVEHGDMLQVLGRMVANGERVHAIVTDPPYHLTSIVKRFGAENAAPAKVGETGAYARASRGFMGKKWDGGDVAFRPGTWRLCWELLPPGGYLLAFSGTRTYHRMVTAIEEAGFEIRDMVAWLYGSGFPKSHNVSKGIDKAAGATGEYGEAKSEAHKRYIEKGELRGDRGHEGWQRPWMDDPEAVANAGRRYIGGTDAARQWEGWGTALKPALEPICLARKPLVGTVAANVLAHGTGALNIDGCRIEGIKDVPASPRRAPQKETYGDLSKDPGTGSGWNPNVGRWPANVCHDGSEEVVRAFPDRKTGGGGVTKENHNSSVYSGPASSRDRETIGYADNGSAARFFFSAKADTADRLGSKHPTVKPVDLMRWLVRLITPPGGTVLDPFAGSGTTGMACLAEGFDCILVEREDEYVADIRRRLAHVKGEDTPLFAVAAS